MTGRKRGWVTAEELMRDPEYIARLQESEKRRQQARAEYTAAAAPMLAELAAAGFPVDSLDPFVNTNMDYRDAIPILMYWLPRIDNSWVKESIVRSLTVPWAKPQAAPLLIEEFPKLGEARLEGTTLEERRRYYVKWLIGNALAVVADDSVFEDLVNLVRDRRHGRAPREMLAVALANMKNPQAVDVLIELLNDEEVAGGALFALRKLGKKAAKARPQIERFVDHPKPFWRQEAQRALAKIDKVK